jgi:hypothetical protein
MISWKYGLSEASHTKPVRLPSGAITNASPDFGAKNVRGILLPLARAAVEVVRWQFRLTIRETVYRGKIRPFGKTEKSLGDVLLPKGMVDDLWLWKSGDFTNLRKELPIGGVALVQLICYSLDRVFLRRRWTSIDLLRLTLWRTVSPTVAILFLASGFNAFYERRLVGIVWLVIAAIVAMLGMLRLRFAEGMKLQEVIRWGTLQTGIRSGEDDEDAFETSVCRSGRQRAPNQRLWGFAHYCSDRQLRKIPDKCRTRICHWA